MAGNKRVFHHGKQHGKPQTHATPPAPGAQERVEGPAPREDVLEMDGEVIKILGFGNYSVKINELDMIVNVSLAGKMKKFNISVILGDKVKVELNPHDPTIGRIVYRYK